ncbi:FbpB family small basic protein [Desertibacillus haloalkaliphilus]|uniref:FbpB family small basic protein n=1 Tax=Desertibacillus haloalkaliphilus TaxID=1328930 RepID=UPI001C252CEA|nr:FbpB family small basic protein [Desertibacillus haloalkaliphilus]MBU8906183.1 FbpB family small basic protein [Desertibacillus haloalkaliphilus]
MKKRFLNLEHLIQDNKREILANEEDLERIEKRIDDRHQPEIQTDTSRERKPEPV